MKGRSLALSALATVVCTAAAPRLAFPAPAPQECDEWGRLVRAARSPRKTA
jgi:hypothetical protein